MLETDYFITTWETTTDDEEIQFPISGNGYNVDWGDGSHNNNNNTNLVSHTYVKRGIYTVKVYGKSLRVFFRTTGTSSRNKLKTVEQWGKTKWISFEGAFYRCSKLLVNSLDVPDLSEVTNMANMFSGASSFNSDLSGWDVSNIVNMSAMFSGASMFNQDIGNWDIKNVTNMSEMFYAALLFNQDLNSWGSKLNNVTAMRNMFSEASKFNQDLNLWDVSNVTSMSGMFSGAALFNGNISRWNVSKVTSTDKMFSKADAFNGDLSVWNTVNVTSMEFMFYKALSFNQDLNLWNVSNVKDMSSMFHGAQSFNQSLKDWSVSNVTSMDFMFYNTPSFNQDVSLWNVSNVTNMSNMFHGAQSFNQDLKDWNVTNVTNMSYMFQSAQSFNEELKDWNVSNITDMRHMFFGASIFNRDISEWDVSNVSNMSAMFSEAREFNQDLSRWDVANVTIMNHMFNGAEVFNSNLSQWKDKVGNVTDMSWMFNKAKAFNSDLSEWDVGKVTYMANMFNEAKIFNSDLSQWNVGKVTNMRGMFHLAVSFDQDIGTWNVIEVTDMAQMFKGVKLSIKNYDELLIGWNQKNLKNNVRFDGGNSKYCKGTEARATIIEQFKWTITDAGQECKNTPDATTSTITANPIRVEANGRSKSIITVQLKDGLGTNISVGGEVVEIISSLGSITRVNDNNNGSYTAELSSAQVGAANISFTVNGSKGLQSAIVSFYKLLGCSVDFTIQTDQPIVQAEGRYRSEGKPETSWSSFSIIDVMSPSTPVINTKGTYDLEVKVKGVNDRWSSWYVCPSFSVNDCVEEVKGDGNILFNDLGELISFYGVTENNVSTDPLKSTPYEKGTSSWRWGVNGDRRSGASTTFGPFDLLPKPDKTNGEILSLLRVSILPDGTLPIVTMVQWVDLAPVSYSLFNFSNYNLDYFTRFHPDKLKVLDVSLNYHFSSGAKEDLLSCINIYVLNKLAHSLKNISNIDLSSFDENPLKNKK